MKEWTKNQHCGKKVTGTVDDNGQFIETEQVQTKTKRVIVANTPTSITYKIKKLL